ncbi:hypothetical protein PHYC_03497 [Phycisphaerales bacterium]|nr:hypothetical protein PHYC_03497 [Phycisphaerales bacterium]
MLVGATFATVIGLLAVDFSDAVEDNLVQWLFVDEKAVCAEAILSTEGNFYTNTSFAMELAEAGVLSKFGGEGGAHLENAIKQTPPRSELQVDRESAQDVLRRCYFALKNIVFREGNYFIEMRDYKNRIDFSRAIVFICWLLAPVSIGCTIWGLSRDAERKRVVGHGATLLALVIALGLCAKVVLAHEEDEQDKRVFGYGLTLIMADRPESPK